MCLDFTNNVFGIYEGETTHNGFGTMFWDGAYTEKCIRWSSTSRSTNNVSTVMLFSFWEGGRGVCTCGVGFGFGGGWGVQSGQPFAPLDTDIMHFFGITTSKLNSGGPASICLTNATIYFDTEVTLMFVRMKLMKVTLFGRMLSNQSLKDYVKCNSL